jgi:hypothetical protein
MVGLVGENTNKGEIQGFDLIEKPLDRTMV